MKHLVMGSPPISDEPLLPCTQLRTNRCMPLLCLPMSLCKLLYSEHDSGDAAPAERKDEEHPHNCARRSSTDLIPVQPSLFEQRVIDALVQHPLIPMRELHGAFSSGRNHYCREEFLEIIVRVATDVASVAASSWADMEVHMSTIAVVILLNSYEHEASSSLKMVEYVLAKYFKGCVCRCVVLDSLTPADTQTETWKHIVLPVSTSTPVKEIADRIRMEIALASVRQADARLVELSSTIASVTVSKPTGDLTSVLRMRGSSSKGGKGSTAQTHGSATSLLKRKGDLLLMLGALPAALMSYEEALDGADALWCAVILESIVTVRFLQNMPMFRLRGDAESLLVALASGENAWSNDMKAMMENIERATSEFQLNLGKALASLKRNPALSSLWKKLAKEVEDPLSSQCESLKRRLKSFDSTMSTERVEKYGKRALGCLRQIIHFSFCELHLYLNEALQLLGTVVGVRAPLRERELNIHLKCAELWAEEGDKRAMLVSFTSVKALASQSFDRNLQQRIRTKIAYICARSGCWRKAIYYIVEAALSERRRGAGAESISLLSAACRAVGIPFPKESSSQGIVDLIRSQQKWDRWGPVSANSSTGGSYCGEHHILSPLDTHLMKSVTVPLLTTLLKAITEDGMDYDARCDVACILLFEHYPFLGVETQASLMSLIAQRSAHHQSFQYSSPPFLKDMKVLALPSNLQPRTISLSGAQFTFIDTSRLKMTVLTLNGKVIPQGQVVWTVGTVGEVAVVLKNPLLTEVALSSVTLSCRSTSCADTNGDTKVDGEEQNMLTRPPSTYVISDVTLQPMSKAQLNLKVQPNVSGFLCVDGIEITLGKMPWCGNFMMPAKQREFIPVLEELPRVSCTFDVNELKIFCGQTVEFTLHVTNIGRVPIHALQITVHDESCQLDTCEGCRERESASSLYVTLGRGPCGQELSETLLEVGGVTTRRVTVVSPFGSNDKLFQHIVFRTSVEIPHEQPVTPPSVPSAVPVFAVIPRRVEESYLRVFQEQSVTVTSVSLSRDKRYIEIRVKNMNSVHTIELLCSHMSFAGLSDALIVAGAEYLLPPIEITKVPHDTRQASLPWVVRGQPKCRGTLSVDLSIASTGVACTEPLEEAVVTISAASVGCVNAAHAKLSASIGGKVKDTAFLTLPVMRPLQLVISVSAPWRRIIPLRVHLSMEQQALDTSVLSGAVDVVTDIGGGTTEDGARVYREVVEVFAFKAGEHPLSVTLSDTDGREIMHAVKLQWKHM